MQTTTTENRPPIPTDLTQALRRLDAACLAILSADPQPISEMLSDTDEVALLGAFGGHVTGRDEVSARLDRTAASYGGGGCFHREPIARWATPDLACTVDLEHWEWADPNAGETTYVYRTTHLLRKEAGHWKVVLRHADPLASFRGPEFAHRQG
ncbi:MAG: YybH family protein [Acidimicrobiales bacterium]